MSEEKRAQLEAEGKYVDGKRVYVCPTCGKAGYVRPDGDTGTDGNATLEPVQVEGTAT